MAGKYDSTDHDVHNQYSFTTPVYDLPVIDNDWDPGSRESSYPDFRNGTAAPSSINMPKLKLFVVFIYAFLSLAVFCNFRVIYMVIRILTTRNPSLLRHDGNRHAFIYVLSLSVVDALVLAHLPLVATDIVLSRWIFGDAVCKLYWLLEQVNRILSTFILTALSADRYLAVCFPCRFNRWRTTLAASCVIGACVFLAASLLSPTFIYSHVVEWRVSNHTISKCMFAMDSATLDRFLTYIFICGYCIPFISMVCFYGSILRTLWRRPKSRASSSDGLENGNDTSVWTSTERRRRERALHVTKRALVLVTFYFACWSPYWFVMFYIQFALADDLLRAEDGMIIAIYAVHVLVYVNSAVNPFLYALLNKELQRQHSSLRNIEKRTAGADQQDILLSSCRVPLRNDVVLNNSGALNSSHGNLLEDRPTFYSNSALDNNDQSLKAGLLTP